MEKKMLAPGELCESFCAIGERKAALPWKRMLVLAVFGGMFIALAGVASTWASMLVENLSLRRLIAGCVFPAGLAMVLITGVELFTGNHLMTIAWLEKRITLGAMLRNWAVVYCGNLIGAVLIAALAVFGGVFSGNESVLIAAAAGKILPFFPALFRGILCNILVCMGVLMAGAAQDVAGKIIAQFFPVAAFIMAGYEHCVANMYYFSAAIFADPTAVSLGGVLGNMIPVTLGNIIGGGFVLGAGYWYAYRKA